MAKPLSEQLADLSIRAKNAENAAVAAQKEARDKIMARRDQARAAATSAIEKVNQDIKSDRTCRFALRMPRMLRLRRRRKRVTRSWHAGIRRVLPRHRQSKR